MRIRSSPIFLGRGRESAATRIGGEDAVREAAERPTQRVEPQPSEHEHVLVALPAAGFMRLRTLYRRTETGWLEPLPSRTNKEDRMAAFRAPVPQTRGSIEHWNSAAGYDLPDG